MNPVLEETINRREQLKSTNCPGAQWAGTDLIAGPEIEQSLGWQLGSGTHPAFLLWITTWINQRDVTPRYSRQYLLPTPPHGLWEPVLPLSCPQTNSEQA